MKGVDRNLLDSIQRPINALRNADGHVGDLREALLKILNVIQQHDCIRLDVRLHSTCIAGTRLMSTDLVRDLLVFIMGEELAGWEE